MGRRQLRATVAPTPPSSNRESALAENGAPRLRPQRRRHGAWLRHRAGPAERCQGRSRRRWGARLRRPRRGPWRAEGAGSVSARGTGAGDAVVPGSVAAVAAGRAHQAMRGTPFTAAAATAAAQQPPRPLQQHRPQHLRDPRQHTPQKLPAQRPPQYPPPQHLPAQRPPQQCRPSSPWVSSSTRTGGGTAATATARPADDIRVAAPSFDHSRPVERRVGQARVEGGSKQGGTRWRGRGWPHAHHDGQVKIGEHGL